MENDLKNSKSKSEGTTPSERYLTQLCRRAFLDLWSYPNLYTDEGRRGGKGGPHELCDLLVVFENDVVIFSIKNIKFNRLINPLIAWRRWFKKAILGSAKQVYGAETWLRRYPDRIFLDPLCKNRIPLHLPNNEDMRIHRIIVALGVYEACKDFYGGNSLGSLMIMSDLIGINHLDIPFRIGHINPEKGFIHIFDDLTFDVVLRELDTVFDLLQYLIKKEKLLSKKKPIIFATGEEQLLSRYITQLNQASEHDFNLPKEYDCILLDEGSWESMINNEQYLRKKQEDQISYTWDRLIEYFIKYGRGYEVSGNDKVSISEIEQALRLMASEPRLRRRQLGYTILNLLEKSKSEGRTRLLYSNDFPDIAYLFLIFPQLSNQPYNEYLKIRREILLAYCKVAKLITPSIKNIIGIATEPLNKVGASEDLIALELNEWTPEMEEEARILQRKYNLLVYDNIERVEFRTPEYPEVPSA